MLPHPPFCAAVLSDVHDESAADYDRSAEAVFRTFGIQKVVVGGSALDVP